MHLGWERSARFSYPERCFHSDDLAVNSVRFSVRKDPTGLIAEAGDSPWSDSEAAPQSYGFPGYP